MTYETLEAATNAKLDLVRRIQSIEVQLIERAATVVGRVPDAEYKEYVEWKARACRAKASLSTQLARTKAEIQRLRYAAVTKRIGNRTHGDGLLNDLFRLTRSLVAAGANISAEDQALLDDINIFLNEAYDGERQEHRV